MGARKPGMPVHDLRRRLADKAGSQYVEQVLHWPHCRSEADSTAVVGPLCPDESMCRAAAARPGTQVNEVFALTQRL